MVALLKLTLSVMLYLLIDSTWTAAGVGADDVTTVTPPVDVNNANLDDGQQVAGLVASYKKRHNKQYKTSAEAAKRAGLLLNAFRRIKNHNALKTGVTLNVNHMSDMTDEELANHLGAIPPATTDDGSEDSSGTRRKRFFYNLPVATTTTTTTTVAPTTTFAPASPAPASMNWNSSGYVTSVKYQGSCGCCWSFAAAGAIEAALMRSRGFLTSVSIEQFVDCLNYQGGCGGGWDTNVYNWIAANRSIATDQNYNFTLANWNSNSTVPACKINSVPNLQVTLTNKLLAPRDDANVLSTIGNIGPVSASFNVSTTSAYSFYYYSSGIINPSDVNFCGPTINHQVLITGYDTDPSGIPYWICKNSWGINWGEQGFFRVARNVTGACGLTIFARIPTTN